MIVHISFLSATFDAEDSTYQPWIATIAGQIAMCMSIVTACSPQFKPFLERFQSAALALQLDTFPPNTSTRSKHRMTGSDASSKGFSINLHGVAGRQNRNDHLPYVRTFVSASSGNLLDWDCSSQTSQSRIIRETRTVTIIEEPRQAYCVDDNEIFPHS